MLSLSFGVPGQHFLQYIIDWKKVCLFSTMKVTPFTNGCAGSFKIVSSAIHVFFTSLLGQMVTIASSEVKTLAVLVTLCDTEAFSLMCKFLAGCISRTVLHIRFQVYRIAL